MNELRNPICFLRGLWWNFRYGREAFWQGAWLSGHNFEEAPSSTPDEQILRCKTCGYESVGFI